MKKTPVQKQNLPWQLKIGLYGLGIGLAAGYISSKNLRSTGICTSRFMVNLAGVIKLHSFNVLNIFPPELAGVVLGAFLAAILNKEWRGRSSLSLSSLVMRFFIGWIIIFGAIVFVGCPVRALVDFGNGNLSTLVGFASLALGVLAGMFFLRRGFTLRQRDESDSKLSLIFPLIVMIILLIAMIQFVFSLNIIISLSTNSQTQILKIIIGLAAGLGVGYLAQRSRFCTVSSIRDTVMMKNFDYLAGLLGFVIGVLFVQSFITGVFSPRLFHGAQYDILRAILSMFTVGFGSSLLEGCPFRHLIKASQGSLDAIIVFLGMLFGAGITWRLGLDSDGGFLGANGLLVICIGVLVIFANFSRTKY